MALELQPNSQNTNDLSSPRLHEVKILPPISVELFFAGSDTTNNLPTKISTNPILVEQASSRRNLALLLDQIYTSIPNPNLNIFEALEQGLIGQSTIITLWDNLTNFLEQDQNNIRILLYLPFELLPDLNQEEINQKTYVSAKRFASLYRQGWIRLLHETESRANFTDGDILEKGLPSPEKISKAGHLTPELLKKEIISEKDTFLLIDLIDQPQMLKSLAEGVIVAKNLGLINSNDIEKIIKQKFPSGLGAIKYPEAFSKNISSTRAKWLKKVADETSLDAEADLLSQKIQELGLSVIDFTTPDSKIDYWKIVSSAILKTLNSDGLTTQLHKLIDRLWQIQNPEITNILIGGLNRLARIGIIQPDYLENLGIRIPDLSSPLPIDLENIYQEFPFVETIAKIEADPMLQQVLYPAFLVFGSRLKGYHDIDTDYDLAVFLKPQAKYQDRDKIFSHLAQIAPEVTRIDKILEYWMGEKDHKLYFKSLPENPLAIGESQIHFFLGGAWITSETKHQRIYEDILDKYLDLSRHDDKQSVRSSLLGQIELDILQYRLLHKGYKKLYPSYKKPTTQNLELIDWDSDFWDPGYRRVATKLFLSRVFLPDLS